MVAGLTQIALLIAGLAIVASFIAGSGLRSGMVVVGICIAAAAILHFAAP